jgi:hypothetical protein
MKKLFGLGLLGVVLAVFTLPAFADDYDNYHGHYHHHYHHDYDNHKEVYHHHHHEVVTPTVVVRVPGR